MRRGLFILIVLCAIAAQAQAQGVVDEHFQQQLVQKQQQQMQSQLESKVDNLTILIKNLYYADECGVFQTKGGDAYMIWYPIYYRLLTQEQAFRVPRFGERVEQAKQQGKAAARSVGCSYWREHQELIAELREQARTSHSLNMGWMFGGR